jgi:hypothetical protein
MNVKVMRANADNRFRLLKAVFVLNIRINQESKMDVSQITSLATGLDNMELANKISTLVLKKTLDNQQSMASGILDSIPQLPANPAIGRNINTTA